MLPGVGCGIGDTGVPGGPPPGESALLYWQVDGSESVTPRMLAESISALGPDIAVLDLGHGAAETLAILQQDSGVGTHLEVLPGDGGVLALLSRFPIQARQSEPRVSYHMGGEERRMRYGILDVTIHLDAGSPLRVVAVAAKDKTFDPVGQSEMRRNELRLVTRHLERLVKANPRSRLILVGALNDDPGAASLRGLTGGSAPLLQDLRPLDPYQDAWTSHAPETDNYLRNHYALVQANSPFHGSILNDSSLRGLSRHRPLLIQLAPPP